MTWVLDVPNGESTGATRRNRPNQHVMNKASRVSRSGATDVSISGTAIRGIGTSGAIGGSTVCRPGAGMVVGWG